VKLRRVIEEEPVPPRRLRQEIARDLETICLKCLQKDPSKRYASAEELAGRLRMFLEGRPIPDRPTGKVERLWRWCRRNPALAASLTVAAALLLGGTGVSSYFALAEAEQAESARKNLQTAVAARANLEKSDTELRQERDKLETALVRSLLRPLGRQTLLQTLPEFEQAPPLTDREIEALWELASQQSEGVRRRFVSEALQQPVFTRQLRDRAQLALNTAIGLDVRRREEFGRLLLARLQEQAVLEDQRTDIALAAAALEDLSPQALVAIRRILTQAMSKTTDTIALQALAEGVAAVGARLEPEEAAQAARALTLAMTKTNNPSSLGHLAVGLGAVAGRLEPEEAARHCAQAAHALTRAIPKTTEPYALRELAQGLAAVAARLEPAVAAQVARALTQAKTRTTDPYAPIGWLAQGLPAVAARLEPDVAAQVARALTQAMTEAAPNAQGSLAQCLAAVGARLEPEEAAQAARALTQAITRITDPKALSPLAQCLAAVGARLEPEEAAQAARALSQAMTRTTAPHVLKALAQGLAAVAARLEPEGEAAWHCAQAASALTLTMTKTKTNLHELKYLAQGVAAVAGRLSPEEAARHCAQAARALTQAMPKVIDVINLRDLRYLAEALAAVAARLEAEEAAQAARALTLAMTEATPTTQGSLAQCLAAVGARLEPEEAARHCAQAARTLTQEITSTTDPSAMKSLAKGLAAVTCRLEPKQAVKILSQAMTKTTEPSALNSLAQGLAATLTEGARTLPVRTAGLVGGVAASDRQLLLAPDVLVLAVEPPPCRLSTQQLVDLLKHPFCVGQARRAVLEQLENRYRRPFTDHWEFVRFATEQRLGLDFTTPPQRPEAVLPEARK
jgi:hypothetical protein